MLLTAFSKFCVYFMYIDLKIGELYFAETGIGGGLTGECGDRSNENKEEDGDK